MQIVETLRQSLTKRRYLGAQLLLLLLLSGTFSITTIDATSAWRGQLSHDRYQLYGQFRDNFHSLNAFGDPAWWNPVAQAGFPTYYFGILGTESLTPLNVCISTLAWVTGQMGIYAEAKTILRIYVVYQLVIVPLLLGLAIWLLARHLIRKPPGVFFSLIVGAYSPGSLFNITDDGIELTALALFATVAWLWWLRRPTKTHFLYVVVTAAAVCVSTCHLALYWNIIFVPALFLIVSTNGLGFSAQFKRAISSQRRSHWLALFGVCALCLVPALATYVKGEGIVRSTTSTRVYPYKTLQPGNPAEILLASTPGVGFAWDRERWDRGETKHMYWRPLLLYQGTEIRSYGYLGLLTLPLATLFLLGGREPWRGRLFWLLAFGGSVILLSGFSPVFFGLLHLIEPLRAVNHYSDTVFRLGLWVFLVLAAGGGLALVCRSERARRQLLWLFATTSLVSALFLIQSSHEPLSQWYPYPLACFLALLFCGVLIRFARKRLSEKALVSGTIALCLLTYVDVSAFAYVHTRLTIASGHLERVALNRGAMEISMGGQDAGHMANLLSLTGLPKETVPELKKTLPYACVVEPGTSTIVSAATADVLGDHSTYNQLAFKVQSPTPAQLVVRDAFFPGWRAWVNGQESEIARHKAGVKVVRIPAGDSVVRMRFDPGLKLPIGLAYVAIVLTAILALFCAVRS